MYVVLLCTCTRLQSDEQRGRSVCALVKQARPSEQADNSSV